MKDFKMRVHALVILGLLLLCGGSVFAARSSYSSALFITAGVANRESVSGKTVYSIGWEGWIVPCRAFGFYIDASLQPDEANALLSTSYGIALRTPGFHDFKPYLMLGFMVAKTEIKEDLYAMPVTIGAEYWLTRGFGVRAHARYQVFCKKTMYSLQGGVFFRL